MVEVFSTNITDRLAASRLLDALHGAYMLYVANFDLDDRDRVLRVKSLIGDVDADKIIALVRGMGYHAEVMSDDIPVTGPPLAYLTD